MVVSSDLFDAGMFQLYRAELSITLAILQGTNTLPTHGLHPNLLESANTLLFP